MVDVSIIILSFNTKELLRDCLRSVIETTEHISYEIIVVDNASTDGSPEMVQKEFSAKDGPASGWKDVLLLENKKNLGFSAGNNIGLKKAKGKYILFLNSDTVVFKGSIETMYKFMESHSEAGAATCYVELPNGKLDDSSHRGFPTPWRAFSHFSGLSKIFPNIPIFAGYNLTNLNLNETHEIDSCSGAFMIVRREAGEQVGWWDEDFFWYGDDLDFCYRLKEKKWKVYFVPSVKILHYKGASGGIKKISRHLTRATRETRIRVTKARFEAMKIFYKKHYVHKYPKIVTWITMKGINLKLFSSLRSI